MTEYGILNRIFNSEAFKQDELSVILPNFKKRNFKKGEYLLRRGDMAHYYWFVEEGFIRSYAIDTEGNDVTTNFYTQGDIVIDWPAFFMRAPTKENIQTLTPCQCWQLDYETFQQLFHSIQSFREAGRGRLVQSYFELKRHSTSLITDHAKERYLRLIQEKKSIAQSVPLRHIASYLGIKPQSLSRIRNEIVGEE